MGSKGHSFNAKVSNEYLHYCNTLAVCSGYVSFNLRTLP